MNDMSAPAPPRRDASVLPMAWIARMAIAVVTIGFVAGSALNALMGFRDIAILLALGGPLGVVGWAFARVGHHVAAVIMVSCVVVGIVAVKMVIGPLGIHDPAGIAFAGVVLLNALILSRPGFLAMTALALGAATAAFLANHLGAVPGRGPSPASWVTLVQFLFITGMIGVVGRLVFEMLFGRLGIARGLAHHDALTGLPNRKRFLEQVADWVRADAAGRGSALLVLVDVDGFRRINMVVGHTAADRILAEVARRVVSVRPGTLAGRVGDDEIAVLATGLADAAAADELARQLQELLTFEHAGVRVRVTLGAAPVDAKAMDADHLLAEADRALAEAKSRRPPVQGRV